MKPLLALFILAYAAQSQVQPQAVATPEFEVASIKPSQFKVERIGNHATYAIPTVRIDPGRLVATNVPLKYLIIRAYGVSDEYILGGPNWISSSETIFNVEATTGVSASQDQILLMLQRLLADRFKLTLHREKKEMPVF